MAAYFHGSAEIQPGEGLHTLYLLNPNCLPYSDTPNTTQTLTNSDTFFHNTTPGNALNTITQPHAPPPITSPSPPPFMGIPLPGAPATVATVTTTTLNEISTLHGMVPKLRPSVWGSLDTSQIVSQQGLSLTLSTQQQQQQQQQQSSYGDVHVPAPMSLLGGASAEKLRVVGSNSLGSMSNPVSVVLLSSKYLAAVQELLDEVVKVEREIRMDLPEGSGKERMKLSGSGSAAGEMPNDGEKLMDGGAPELTPAQRQELQVKKAKLISMLDEVEQKYRQYHGQMQLVITSFEQAAGFGSVKSYTALALQTISKQFRALKDAISAQIKIANKSLGDEAEGPRLRYVDNHFRQQRALHQLGMVQHNAWRPQRGLPESAVSVLRAWLFEHFLHPYPKDSDKHMLAKQTGLTRGQVSNWFINARVRLWKPMVEEMYLEETKNQEEEGTSLNPTTKSEKPLNMKQTSTQNTSKSISQENDFLEIEKFDKSANPNIPLSSGIERNGIITQPSPKSPKRSFTCSSPSPSSILSMDMDTKPPTSDQTTRAHQVSGGNFGVYSSFTPEVLRSYGNSNVSLTLGLPCEATTSLSPTQQSFMSNHHQGFHLGRRFDMGNSEAGLYELGRTSNYEAIDFTQNRKRFAAQLLPDYVT